MIKLINTRKWFTSKSTIGELKTENGEHICYILEPPDFGLSNDLTLPAILLEKERVWNELRKYAAVAPGDYPLIMAPAPHLISRFPQLEKLGITEFPELTGIKGSQGVFIHPGNFPDDTEECQLPGVIANIDSVGSSTSAWELIMKFFKEQIQNKEVIYSIQRDAEAWLKFKNAGQLNLAI